MPKCIYCKVSKSSAEFSKEHVLTRAFCGAGDNWTLVDMVCSHCNERFSGFEAHWSHSAVEAMMRNFSGPVGRSGGSDASRQQPIECDHIYIVERNDELVYEAGFAFPSHPYFRPQCVQAGDGVVCLVPERRDIEDFRAVLDEMVKKRTLEVSKPIRSERGIGGAFEVATLVLDIDAKKCSMASTRIEEKASGYWFRSFPSPSTIYGLDGISGVLTPRCALDDRRRLYFRADDWAGVTGLLTDLLKNRHATRAARGIPEQTVAIRHVVKLPQVFRAVMKTGVNFVAKVAGSAVALDRAFDDVRRMILDPGADDDVVGRCGFLGNTAAANWGRAGFPSAPSIDEHRMMLDEFAGTLRFRIRLYGSLGYECVLGPATRKIRESVGPRRASVDFAGDGIQSVSEWL